MLVLGLQYSDVVPALDIQLRSLSSWHAFVKYLKIKKKTPQKHVIFCRPRQETDKGRRENQSWGCS